MTGQGKDQRSGGSAHRIAHAAGDADQADLTEHAWRLTASVAAGKFVLGDDAADEDATRRLLLPATDDTPVPGAGGPPIESEPVT